MKSATSTLHYLLAQHEEVFIPDGEVHFFSVDDAVEHPEFFHRYGSEWAFQDYERQFDTYRAWYRSFFEDAASDQVIGEDSTVYLASEKAPARIADLLPDVQLIFLLRDPVDRAYSHYWHLLRTGRATHRFRDALQYGRATLLTRGFYRQQLERYFDHFPREQITVLLFEDFIQDLQGHVDSICGTLGLSGSVDLSAVATTTRNTARIPRWPGLLAFQNWLLQSRNARHYQHHLPDMPTDDDTFVGWVLDNINFRVRNWNLEERSAPPMAPSTKSFLQRLYAKENRGLSDLIGVDLAQYWPYMETHSP
jgi:hypothetical protein